jgi:hypothetical protein
VQVNLKHLQIVTNGSGGSKVSIVHAQNRIPAISFVDCV